VLTNRDDPSAGARLSEELARNPGLSAVMEIVQSETRPYALDAEVAGLEIVPQNRVKNVPNRCRLKLFRPRETQERLCAFFYKRSNLAWSRDRFSYGAVEFRPAEVEPEAVRSWLEWLSSGFDPERRPAGLKRAFRYTIPE
jgi:hypothetical protein